MPGTPTERLRKARIFIHAGLPRTATTTLQASVFPRMTRIRYLGKNAENTVLRGEFNPLVMVKEICDRVRRDEPAAIEDIRPILPAVIKVLKGQNQFSNRTGSKSRAQPDIPQLFTECLSAAASMLDDQPVLYSDESLVESISGLAANTEFGDSVPLEQLHATGLLEHASLSVVLRAPEEFLKASYYKTMEFRHSYKEPALSFDEYIRRQLRIHERSPTASRIFLCRHQAARKHFLRLCPRTVVIDYRELIAAAHVADTLLGCPTGEVPISLSSLPRENSSWRNVAANSFVLAAEGVPQGIDGIEEYAATFPETLRRYGVDQMFAGEQL